MRRILAQYHVPDAGYTHGMEVDERHAVVVEQAAVHENVAVDDNSQLAGAYISAHEAILGHAVTEARHDVVIPCQ